MRILLLGATGFLGRRIERALRAARGDFDLVTACRTTALVHLDNTGHARPISALRLDLASCSDAELADLLVAARPDVVINATGALRGSVHELARTNHFAVVRLVACMERVASQARLVHLSSSAEIGPGEFRRYARELDRCRPDTAYGRTKLIGTTEVRRARFEGTLDTIILRAFDVLGDGCGPVPVAGSMARRILHAVHAGAPSVELPALDAYLDLVDADDVAAAVVAACRLPRDDIPILAAGPVINVASGVPTLGRTLAQQLAAAAGYGGDLRSPAAGVPAHPGPRSAEVVWQVADTRRAAAVLGWGPRIPLARSVHSLWRSLLDAPASAPASDPPSAPTTRTPPVGGPMPAR